MKKSAWVIIMFSACIACLAQSSKKGRGWDELLKEARKGEQKVEFYGVVLDQWKKPVEGAEVLYETSAYGIFEPVNKKGKATTDAEGRFEIHGGAAAKLYIRDIVLHGYDFSWEVNEKRSFDYDRGYRSCHRPDKSNPVAFHLRKKLAAGTYLLKEEFTIVLEADAEELYWARDFDKGWDSNPRSQKDPKVFWDIEVSGMLDLKKKEWRLTFKTNGEHSGIQVRDEFLYEAPADGYAKSLDAVFPVAEYGKFPVRYLYVRLREPGMYARFEIGEDSGADEKRLLVLCKGVVNPYGDRSFEELKYDTRVERVRFSRCRHEATDAFRHQRLAPRPPFEEWIKEGKARY